MRLTMRANLWLRWLAALVVIVVAVIGVARCGPTHSFYLWGA
jgi:hypothetical protein